MNQFKNMKFKVGSDAEAAALQEYLFMQGYKWVGGQEVDHIESRVFFTDDLGYISHQYSEYDYFDKVVTHTEVDVEFITTVAFVSEKRPTRTTLSGVFTKKQLEEIVQSMD